MEPVKLPAVISVIFVVDDDVNILLMLKQFLEHEGYLVFGAEHPMEAIAKLRILRKANHPQLIITDLNMPFDGERLINVLANDDDFKQIPILPVSATDRKQIAGKAIFPKPFDLKDLISKIDALIKKKAA